MQPKWKKYLLYVSITIGTAVSILIVTRIMFLGYTMILTGFDGYTSSASDFAQERTLWDWMELLIVSLVLTGGAFHLLRSEWKTERKHAGENAKLGRETVADRQQEVAFQSYLDEMAELLQDKNLRTLENEEVRNAAKIRTLSVLEALDGRHRGMVLRFLKESALIELKPVIDLNQANLAHADLERTNLNGTNLAGAYLAEAKLQEASLEKADLQEANLYLANLAGASLIGAKLTGADLYFANLSEADLGEANLERANLSEARLWSADLSGANLSEADLGEANLERANLNEARLWSADLSGANLSEADLSGADLGGAKVAKKHLATAGSLKGATLPDGTRHE
jgi:uncharacterized protein YjbI with pentapeptide repeats